MELEDQVCSLELAKKLKGLGAKQDSLFYWNKDSDDNYEINFWKGRIIENSYSAFTVAELGEMLPDVGWFSSFKVSRIPFVRLKLSNGEIDFEADTEANSRAKALIYFLENNLISI